MFLNTCHSMVIKHDICSFALIVMHSIVQYFEGGRYEDSGIKGKDALRATI